MKRFHRRAYLLLTLRNSGPMTRIELANAMRCKPQSLCDPIRSMHLKKQIHIAGYRLHMGRGRHPAIYAAGPGEDAPRPPANRKAANRRYYEKTVREKRGYVNRRATNPDGKVRTVNMWMQLLGGGK